MLRDPAAEERRKVTFFGVVARISDAVAIWRRFAVFAVFAVVAAALAGCASTQGTLSTSATTEARQAMATERAAARWQAMIKGDYAAAYEFLSDASRKVVSLDRFRSRGRAVVWQDAKIRGATCDAEVCKVEVFVTYDHPKIKGMGFPLTETWVIEKGSVWFVDPGL